jgi:hypothetical protein
MAPLSFLTVPVTSPLALVGALRELVDALKVLPAMAEDVRRMREAVERMTEDTAVLPGVLEATGRLDAIEDRMREIAGTMPEVEELKDLLEPLPATMAELIVVLEGLHATTSGLGVAMEPIARVADRIPGGKGRG